MANGPEVYLEDPSSEVDIDLSASQRKYQTSNIVLQDPGKEGVLTLLSKPLPPDQEAAAPTPTNNDQSFRPEQNTTTGNYS